jgi:hypothetical protein
MGSSSNPPIFVITVNSTDASWFYCSEADHCQNGMVFAINPTVHPSRLELIQSDQTIAQFMSSAGNAGASVSPTGGPTGGTMMAGGSSSASMMSSTESSTSSSTEMSTMSPMSTMESSMPALTSSEMAAGTTSGAVSSPTNVSTSGSNINAVSAVGLVACFCGLFGMILRPVF